MKIERIGLGALLALPGVLTLYLGFSGGGFFPSQPAVVAVFLALVLVVRVTTAEQPFAGLGLSAGIGVGAMALYALWTLVSSSWSHATGRALIEFDRALMYTLAVVLFASIERTAERVRWILRGIVAAMAVLCVVGLVTRILPDLWPTAPNIENSRLSYPVSYWNTLGLIAALGLVLCLHFSSSQGENAKVRVVSAALAPLLALTLYFTFSRAAMAAAVIGLLLYLVLVRSRTSLLALVAIVPWALAALIVAYNAGELATLHPASARGVSEGHHVALAAAGSAVLAALVRLALLRLEAPVLTYRFPPAVRRLRYPAIGLSLLVVAVTVVALHVPHAVSTQYQRFVNGSAPTVHGDLRNRLGDVSNNGRTQQWDAAFAAFDAHPFHGTGAATYQLSWEQRRPYYSYVKDAHGLYFEVLGELGVVGLGLLLVALGAFLTGASRGLRRHRGVYGVSIAMIVAWAARAGVDWDWEMPVVTFGVFAVGGILLARRAAAREEPHYPPSNSVRVVVAVGWLLATVVPGLVAVSEGQLKLSVQAFDRGDCRAARQHANSALSALADQPRPYEIIGYCDLYAGFPRGAIQAMRQAVERDPGNWQYHYDLAVASAEAGFDPRPQAADSSRRNPLEDLTRDIRVVFRGHDPARWKAAGRQARLRMVASGRVARY